MERLTEKTVGCFEYALKDHKAVPGEFCTYDAFFDYSMAVKRLGHYEDTGLEPEEINDMALEVATLKTVESMYDGLGNPDHIRDLLQAEQDGRLVVLPCKVGDTVWYITPSTEICEAQVIGIWLNVYTNPQMWLEIKYYSKFIGECERKSRIDLMLDKTVFLTREEAEAALVQEGGSND